MTRPEYEALAPWISAGVDVVKKGEPRRAVLRKGYLAQVKGGYALTERGARQASQWYERDKRDSES